MKLLGFWFFSTLVKTRSCDTVCSKFCTTWSTHVGSLGPCIQHMLSLKMYFSPLKLSSRAMLIVYFLPSFVNPVTRRSCVRRLSICRRGGNPPTKAGKADVGQSSRNEVVRRFGQLCWCFTVGGASADEPPHPTMQDNVERFAVFQAAMTSHLKVLEEQSRILGAKFLGAAGLGD